MYNAANIELSVFPYVEMWVNVLKGALNIIRRFQVFSKETGSSPSLRFVRITARRQAFSVIKLHSELIRYQRSRGFYPFKKKK